jgi:tRNA-2-methylthio-N6-dimethylallyladenosine synthase
LRGEKHITRRVLLLQTSHGGDANDPPDIERTKRINIRAMVQLVRKQAMPPPMPGQEIDLPAVYAAPHDCIGRVAEGCFHPQLSRIFHPLHLVETASADDPDGRCVFSHRARLNGNCAASASSGWRSLVVALARPAPLCQNPARSMPKFFIKTYGCQMNERDSEQVAHSLLERGYERATREADADVVLLNTCSVRDMAEQKALGKMGMLGQIAKRRPETIFGFLGCMAQARGDSLFAVVPHLDLVVGTQKFHRVADYVEELLEKKRTRRMDDPRFSICDTAEESGSAETIRDHELKPCQATAFVSIMQGCNMHCTFCIVPRTRGAERSRTIDEIVSEVRHLVARGVKEVTLLGQIVNLYGRQEFAAVAGVGDRGHKKSPFVQLLEAVHAIDGLERLRFTSPHPIGFRADLLRALSDLPKLAEHVHLPLQSGSDRILKAMHRPYTAEKYRALVKRIRETRYEIAITTDIIVGFPGEEDDDYKRTRDLVEEIQFDNAFVFRYSTRQETPAAAMPQIDERVKEERNQDLLTVVDASAQRINARLVGRDLEILCEGPSRTNANRLMGRTRTNKIVVFAATAGYTGRVFDIRIAEATGFSLYGTPVMQPSSPVFA